MTEIEQIRRDALRFRWLLNNCYINRCDLREKPYAVIDIWLLLAADGQARKLIASKDSGVGLIQLDKAVDIAMQEAVGHCLKPQDPDVLQGRYAQYDHKGNRCD